MEVRRKVVNFVKKKLPNVEIILYSQKGSRVLLLGNLAVINIMSTEIISEQINNNIVHNAIIQLSDKKFLRHIGE